MGLISSQFPFTDPGSLMGGIREHQVKLEGLQADAFRSAAQAQNAGQAARAFSGADVVNVNSQSADLSQEATASADKTVTIDAVEALNPSATEFNFNYLQRYIAGAEAADLLARGALNLAQDQGADQSGFARLWDFDGNVSTALNELTQDAMADQVVDVDLSATVTNTTLASSVDNADAFGQSRFRTIAVSEEDKSAQAIFTSGQRQGSVAAPASQVAVSDGGDVENVLDQSAVINQGGDVLATALFDLRRDETGDLSPRSTELLAWMKNNSAINSSAASQEQVLVQSAAGGVNEDGQQTENDGVATNSASTSAVNSEATSVRNEQTILI